MDESADGQWACTATTATCVDLALEEGAPCDSQNFLRPAKLSLTTHGTTIVNHPHNSQDERRQTERT
jgi:hypothetical protein